MLRYLIFLLTTVAFQNIANADVYKYTDSDGNTQYTDSPAKLPAERLNVQTQRTDTVTINNKPSTDNQATSKSDTASNAQAQRKAAQANAEDKLERCTKARERYDKYINATRLYEDNNGERRYLDDSELDAARAAAKASMDTFCQ